MLPHNRRDYIHSLIQDCLHRIRTLDENDFVSEMHFFDVDEIFLSEFYKIFELMDINYNLNNKY